MRATAIYTLYTLSLLAHNHFYPPLGAQFGFLNIITAVSVGALSLILLPRLSSNRRFLIFSLLTTAAFFYSKQLYFYWDEWYILEHLMKNGVHGIFHSHNEHFLPLFFGFYFLEISVFGLWYFGYLIISYLIHATNAVLLRSLLLKLFPEIKTPLASIAAFVWLINSLHSEVLQWSFTQAVSVSALFLLLSFHFAIDFLQNGAKRKLMLAIISGGVSPLFFGNGFMIAGYAFFLVLLLYSNKTVSPEKIFKRGLCLLSALALILVAVAAGYWIFRHGAGHGIEHGNDKFSLRSIINYLVVAWGLATIIRGVGFYPELNLTFPKGDLPHHYLTTSSGSVLIVVYAILLLMTVVPAYLYLKRRYFNLFIFGNIIIVLTYALPAIRRHHFGLVQSLSLRYTYFSLIGLILLGLAIVLRTYEKFPSKKRLIDFCLAALFLGYVAIHSHMIGGFEYFRNFGAANEKFVKSLVQWQSDLCKEGGSIATSYDGANTSLAGKAPIMPPSVTPGKHPIEIYKVLTWLDDDIEAIDCAKTTKPHKL